MSIEPPPPPYDHSALAPHMSGRTMQFHNDKHHAGYVSEPNDAIDGADLEGKSLESMIEATAGKDGKQGVFNNAAQV